jgi:hypothetical protein
MGASPTTSGDFSGTLHDRAADARLTPDLAQEDADVS